MLGVLVMVFALGDHCLEGDPSGLLIDRECLLLGKETWGRS